MKTKAISWLRRESWTMLIVTIVSVLIWTWAAGEMRESGTMNQQVRFFVPDDGGDWVVEPPDKTFNATLQGSRQSLERAKRDLRTISIELPARTGTMTIDLLARLADHPDVVRSGVSIVATDLEEDLKLTLDRLVTRSATVRPEIPGVQTQGEISVAPPVVSVRIPGRIADTLPDDLVVEAFVSQSELENKPAGVPLTLSARLRLPAGFASGGNSITFDPPRADVSFTMRSMQRTITLEGVRVQLAGPTEDHAEYIIEIPDPVIANVEVTADNDLIRKIEDGQATVVAIIHLSSREKEQRITAKEVDAFMAKVHDEPGLRQVNARVNGSDTPPTVQVQITDRNPDASSESPSP